MHYQTSSNAMKDGKTLSPDKGDILMAHQKVCFISFMVYFRLFLDCLYEYYVLGTRMNLFCTNHDINIICKDNVFTAFLSSSSMRPQPPLHCGLLPQTDLELN